MKILIKKMATFLGIVPCFDYCLSRWQAFRLHDKNKEFCKINPSFVIPPPELAFDAYGHVNWNFYHSSGLNDAKKFGKLIQDYHPGTNLHILDWGCGPARIIRHISEVLGSDHQLYGTDYNANTIRWCKKNFNFINFSKNSLKPPLSFNNHTFDVIYGLSVCTHLSQTSHFEWIQELKRVLKPSGILILTTHGDYYRKELSIEEKKQYDTGLLVVRDLITEGRRGFVAFQPPKFMEKVLFQDFEIVFHSDQTNNFHIKQDIWVVKPKA